MTLKLTKIQANMLREALDLYYEKAILPVLEDRHKFRKLDEETKLKLRLSTKEMYNKLGLDFSFEFANEKHTIIN